MRQIRIAILTALFAVAATGCYQTTKTITLNPDGSGKLVLEANLPIINLMGGDTDSPEDQAESAIASLLEDAEGVTVWKDVSFKALPDERASFKGTAYFKNISEVKFQNLGDTRITYKKDAHGRMIMDIALGDEVDKEDKPATPVTLTDAEITKQIESARTKFNTQVKPMAAAVLGTMTEEILVHAPGTLKGGSNLTQTKAGAVRLLFSGAKVMEAMDAMMNDDALIREAIKAGRDIAQDGPDRNEDFNELIFGKKGPIRAVFAPPFEPAFNYKLETEAAKAGYQAMLKKIGLSAAMPVPVAPPAEGEGLKSIKVGGVRFVKFEDRKRGIRPFNYGKGYTLSLIAELSGSAISVGEGVLTAAVADNGTDLLPKKEWNRRLHFPSLSEDKSAVIFAVELKDLDPAIKGFKKISGDLEYTTATGSKTVDLGFTDFKTGEGKELGSSITVEPAGDGGSVKLVVKQPRDTIKEILFYDDTGTEVKHSSRSSYWSGTSATMDYEFEKLPSSGKIIVEVYADQKKFKVPFLIENITLLGDPM